MKTLLSNGDQRVPFSLNVNMKNVAFHKKKTLKMPVNVCFHFLKPFLLNTLAELINWIKREFIKFVPLMFWV